MNTIQEYDLEIKYVKIFKNEDYSNFLLKNNMHTMKTDGMNE